MSLPGVVGPVARHPQIVVRGLARSGQSGRVHATGLLARILQHKLDHLDGVLVLDRMTPRRRAAVLARLQGASAGCLLVSPWR